jgi:thiamine-monophosphate kinase
MTPIRFRGGEFAFIDWIRSRSALSSRPKGRPCPSPEVLVVGPGDDACVLDLGSERLISLTTDMLLEGTHFDLATVSVREVGWKAVGASLSDVAAMGMEALVCVAAVGLPPAPKAGCGRTFAEELYNGMRDLADRFGVAIAGGDVTSWRRRPAPLAVCVTVLGRRAGAQPVLRSGARDGDVILVTGELGGSLLGRHVRFMPRLNEGLTIARGYSPHAMIDISDGLSSDLAHVAVESGLGAVIDESRIPLSADARKASKRDGRSPLEHALNDGEDFELLVAMAEGDADRLLRDKPFETRLTVIGRMCKGDELLIRAADGAERRLEAGGYEHPI